MMKTPTFLDRSMKRFLVVSVSAVAGLTVGFGTEKQIEDLKADIAELEQKIAEFGPAGAELSKLQENIKSSETEIAALKESLPKTEAEIANKEKLLPIYQGAFRVVTKLTPGQDLGSFTLKNGITVEPCNFVGIAGGAIQIQSASGSRTISVDQLPDSFADRVLLPPSTQPVPGSLTVIKESKPGFLKTSADKVAEKRIANTSSVSAAGASGAATQTETSAATTAENDYEGRRLRNEQRQRQISELKIQMSELFSEKKRARDAKAADEKMFREAKIKRSKAETESTMKTHETKIAGIEKAESELRAKIARLQLEFE